MASGLGVGGGAGVEFVVPGPGVGRGRTHPPGLMGTLLGDLKDSIGVPPGTHGTVPRVDKLTDPAVHNTHKKSPSPNAWGNDWAPSWCLHAGCVDPPTLT